MGKEQKELEKELYLIEFEIKELKKYIIGLQTAFKFLKSEDEQRLDFFIEEISQTEKKLKAKQKRYEQIKNQLHKNETNEIIVDNKQINDRKVKKILKKH